jgi:hypothetical protein
MNSIRLPISSISGEPAPKSRAVSFEMARNKEELILHHLLLGISAHINHDLAFALYDVKN